MNYTLSLYPKHLMVSIFIKLTNHEDNTETTFSFIIPNRYKNFFVNPGFAYPVKLYKEGIVDSEPPSVVADVEDEDGNIVGNTLKTITESEASDLAHLDPIQFTFVYDKILEYVKHFLMDAEDIYFRKCELDVYSSLDEKQRERMWRGAMEEVVETFPDETFTL